MDSDTLLEFWQVILEYIPAKDKQTAADHAIAHLADIGFPEDELRHFAADDRYLDRAVQMTLGDEDFELEEDWE